jgi:toxin HigB-1
MIESFGNRLAMDLFNDRRSRETRGLPVDLLQAARRKLLYLHDAAEIEDLRTARRSQRGPLNRRRTGFFSVRINGRWRLIFRFDRGTALDAAVVRYR